MAEFPVITRYEVHGAQDVISTNQQLLRSYREGEIGVSEFNKSLKENTAGVYAELHALRGIQAALRVENYEIMQLGRILSGVGSIGRNLVSMWQAYTVGIIRVEQAEEGVQSAELGVAKAHEKVEDAQKEVTKWQKLYNQYLRDFGADSAYTKNAQDQLAQANDYLVDAQQEEVDANAALIDALDRAARAVTEMNIGYASLALSVPSTVADLIRLTTSISAFFALIESKGGVVAALSSSIATLSSTLNGVLPVLTAMAPALAGLAFPEGREQLMESINSVIASIQRQSEQEWWRWIPFSGFIPKETTTQPTTYEQPAATWTQPTPSAPLPSSYWNVTPAQITAEEAAAIFKGLTKEEQQQVLAYKIKGYGLIDALKHFGYAQFGLPYVPETAPYILHKGERVLTANEARMAKQTSGNSFKITLNVYPPPQTTDPEAIARYTLEKVKNWFATGMAM